MMATRREAPIGFRYVKPTADEMAERIERGLSDQYRLECERCGRRIWGSGLAVGSHRNAHRRQQRREL